jgi:hypothetical protein
MKLIRTFLVALVVPALILAIFAVSSVVAGGGQSKVTVCHFSSHKFHSITIAAPAVPAHLQHGDVMPDAYGACP